MGWAVLQYSHCTYDTVLGWARSGRAGGTDVRRWGAGQHAGGRVGRAAGALARHEPAGAPGKRRGAQAGAEARGTAGRRRAARQGVGARHSVGRASGGRDTAAWRLRHCRPWPRHDRAKGHNMATVRAWVHLCTPGCAQLGQVGVLCTLTQFLTRFDSVLFLSH